VPGHNLFLSIVSIKYTIKELSAKPSISRRDSKTLTNRWGIMAGFFSFVFYVLFPLAIGLAGIYLAIDFFEYLKKNHFSKYRQMSYDHIFGISAESFPFHLIRPVAFFGFLFSTDNLQDEHVIDYKKKIKLLVLGLLGLFGLYILLMIIT
jgi:hypothetical protein